jgi:hypothetical protein
MLNQNMPYSFLPIEAGYTSRPVKSVTITNNRRLRTGPLTLELTGPDRDKFDIEPRYIEDIASAKTAVFTIMPKLGLLIGTHSAGVRVSGADGIEAGFDISLPVFALLWLDDAAPASLPGAWNYAGGVFTLLDGAIVTITTRRAPGDPPITDRRIETAANAKVSVSMGGMCSIQNSSGGPVFRLGPGSRVSINLFNSNSIFNINSWWGASGYAGIEVPASAELTISGIGELRAYGGTNGAGIGGSNNQAGGTILITSGKVVAQGGTGAAGIGGGNNGEGGVITIQEDGTGTTTVGASGGTNGAGIGGGAGKAGGTITIKKGTVSAAGIGGGTGGDGGNITITGGEISSSGEHYAAGIGGGDGGSGGNITVSGGQLKIAGGEDAAGIGGGRSGAGGVILINGGAVIAASSPAYSGPPTGGGAGIGGGSGGNGGSINITGGSVIAAPGAAGAGIGAGSGGAPGTFTTGSGKPVIFAPSINPGPSSGPANGIEASAVMQVTYPSFYNATITLGRDFTVPSGGVFTIPDGLTLEVGSHTLTNAGRVINYGTVTVAGGVVNPGIWTGNSPP